MFNYVVLYKKIHAVVPYALAKPLLLCGNTILIEPNRRIWEHNISFLFFKDLSNQDVGTMHNGQL